MYLSRSGGRGAPRTHGIGPRRRIGAALAALATGSALALSTAASPVQSSAAGGTEPARLSVEEVPGSVAYLRSEFGISESEALARLDAQHAFEVNGDRVATALPASYAGIWLDQPRGEMVIRLVDVHDAGAALRALGPVRIPVRFQAARWSLRDLERAQAALAAINDRHVVSFVADVQRNAVVAWGPGDRIRPASFTVPRSVRATPGTLVTGLRSPAEIERRAQWLTAARTSAVPGPSVARTDLNSCREERDRGRRYFELCGGPPMRGGYRLDVTRSDTREGRFGPCTVGFNVRGSNGHSYIITAGHCVTGSRHVGVDRVYHNGVPVAIEVGNLRHDRYPIDFALLRYTPAAGNHWLRGLSRNLVFYHCRDYSPVRCTPGTRNIAITGTVGAREVTVGTVACHTGSATREQGHPGWFPGTRCGRVKRFDQGIVVNNCGRSGDSGSGLFIESSRKAVAVLSGGTAFLGVCRPYEESTYTWVRIAFEEAHAATGVTFDVYR
ncbi:MAG: streptogrisin [Actinomycetota bacterium]|nr:streptogrisin [Actinomycetota bacterium]